MSVASNNRIYKVTSLFIKTAILIISIFYIFHKLNSASQKFDLFSITERSDLKLLLFSFGLMFLNWGIEALKWKVLITSLEPLTFRTSLKSVFAGVTVSIFMPNRIGEFAGRIFFLQKADKVEATLKNLVGSTAQFFVTILIGFISFFAAKRAGYLNSFAVDVFDGGGIRFMILFTAILFVILFVLNHYSSRFSPQVQSWFSAIFETKAKVLITILVLSGIRYFVFLFQYYLILIAFGIELSFGIAFNLIAITFLITSVIPSIALTEIVTRGAVAIYLFSAYTADTDLVLVSSFIVWIINLAIPALIGTAFIWKLKFFKS
jgi:uncharacterized membrane protein YbhN (UPF0104 family)